jgi:hypothetical protein
MHLEGDCLEGCHYPRMETAQNTFKRMMREQVAPKLRVLGFKGSGQKFVLASDSHWALLGSNARRGVIQARGASPST